jgi:hypothetical protein
MFRSSWWTFRGFIVAYESWVFSTAGAGARRLDLSAVGAESLQGILGPLSIVVSGTWYSAYQTDDRPVSWNTLPWVDLRLLWQPLYLVDYNSSRRRDDQLTALRPWLWLPNVILKGVVVQIHQLSMLSWRVYILCHNHCQSPLAMRKKQKHRALWAHRCSACSPLRLETMIVWQG